MNNEKLILSLMKRFGCSRAVAIDWAQDIHNCSSEPNGRLSKFSEINESEQHVVEDDNFFKMKVKARAGIKLDAAAPDASIMARIKHMGGVR